MHLLHRQRRVHSRALLLILIGMLGISMNAGAEEPDLDKLNAAGKAYVEPTHISYERVDGEYKLDPYLVRRPDWGVVVSLGYCSYEPMNYEANFANQPYGGVYEAPSIPFLELQFAVKRNLKMGSLGGELGIGKFENGHSDEALGSPTLSITPIRIGANFYLDNLSPDPVWVPYVSAGVYTMLYSESMGGSSFNGNSQVAPYFLGGIAFALDWIDRHAARVAYEDSRVQGSYLFADVRSYIPSSSDKDPDLSSSFDWGAGLRVEF